MFKSFIDTNVFVHWIILRKIKEQNQKNEKLWYEFKKLRPSFELIESIKTSLIDDFSFFTSHLSLSEIFYSLFDEYRCRRMYLDGVPLSSWQRVKDKFSLSEDDNKTLTDDVLEFLNEFNIFELLKKNKRVQLIPENYDYSLLSKLVIEKKIRTHDAILISTAINSGCKYFITGDRTIRKRKVNEISIISPQKMIHDIKKISQKQK